MNLIHALAATSIALAATAAMPTWQGKTSGLDPRRPPLKLPGKKTIQVNLRFNQSIVFERGYYYEYSSKQLYGIGTSGAGLAELGNPGGGFRDRRDPAPSPNGARIAFAGQRNSEKLEIYTTNPNGSDARVVTTGGPNIQPAWSPNGQQIAYIHAESNSTGQQGVWIMNGNGSNPHRISSSIHSFRPTWTKDGFSILYSEAGSGGANIYRQALTGGQAILIAADASVGNSRIALSPDGTKIAYCSYGGFIGVRNIMGPTPSHGYATLLTSHGLGDNYTDKNPAWSPDGQWIAFERFCPKFELTKEHCRLMLIDAAQGERSFKKILTPLPRNGVTELDYNTNPSWLKTSVLGDTMVRPPNAASGGG